jgi:alpha-ketoglutarate-dependent taurine dioxygenase
MYRASPTSSGSPVGPGLAIGQRLSPAGGVRIDGIDLAQPLSPSSRDRIVAALHQDHVVVFPGQHLTREQQFTFSQNFGEVEIKRAAAGKRHGVAHIISNLDAAGRPVDRSSSPVSNYRWHTDKSYHAVPPMLTTLFAVEMPECGGDTEFANTAMGYAALPAALQRRIAGLRVVFRWGARSDAAAVPPTGPGMPGPGPDPAEREAVDHPLVRTHPETGMRALYLGNHSSHILGLPEADGRALLDRLLAHTTQRRFVYAHRWQQGDLVMWDNRCLLHRAMANYRLGRDRRVLHRTVVAGTVPV